MPMHQCSTNCPEHQVTRRGDSPSPAGSERENFRQAPEWMPPQPPVTTTINAKGKKLLWLDQEKEIRMGEAQLLETVPRIVQVALDGVKEDLVDLDAALKAWKGQPDVWDRVENWLFNTRRHLTDTLA